MSAGGIVVALDPAVDAAYAHVGSMVRHADTKDPFPAWHGWALREAFLAGVAWQRDASHTGLMQHPVTPVEMMVNEARLALRASGLGDKAAFDVHSANARRIAAELDLQVPRHSREEREVEHG